MAGMCDSRFTPSSPSAMLKTMSGLAARRRSGKSGAASRRTTSPYVASALAIASIVGAESHSAYRSSAEDATSAAAASADASVIRDAPSRPVLGGSSSDRAASLSSVASVALSSGFWLYAKPMRVIRSLLIVRGAESPLLCAEPCVHHLHSLLVDIAQNPSRARAVPCTSRAQNTDSDFFAQ